MVQAPHHRYTSFKIKIVVLVFAVEDLSVINSEVVFLVMLGTSSFPARQEIYEKTTENLVPSWERARTQHD